MWKRPPALGQALHQTPALLLFSFQLQLLGLLAEVLSAGGLELETGLNWAGKDKTAPAEGMRSSREPCIGTHAFHTQRILQGP